MSSSNNSMFCLTKHALTDNGKTPMKSSNIPSIDVLELVTFYPKKMDYFIRFAIKPECDIYTNYTLYSPSFPDLAQYIKSYWLECCGNKQQRRAEPFDSVIRDLNSKKDLKKMYILDLTPISFINIDTNFAYVDICVELSIDDIPDIQLICNKGYFNNDKRKAISSTNLSFLFDEYNYMCKSIPEGRTEIEINHTCPYITNIIIQDKKMVISKIGQIIGSCENNQNSEYYSSLVPYQQGLNIVDGTYIVPLNANIQSYKLDLIIESSEPTELLIIIISSNCTHFRNGVMHSQYAQ